MAADRAKAPARLMLSRIARSAPVVAKCSRGFALATRAVETEEWIVYPRETESNYYDLNWSLVNDGITPADKAYLNARLPVLTMNIPEKPKNGAYELAKPTLTGDVVLAEAGDALSHAQFSALHATAQEKLSAAPTLFVEDGVVGSALAHVGVRVVTTNPALALMTRSLLLPAPERTLNQYARCLGWNLEPRAKQEKMVWHGDHYTVEAPSTPLPGQRPVVAMVSGSGNAAVTQFLQFGEAIVGANIVAGEDVPVAGLVQAVGQAACVVINESADEVFAIPSAVVVKGGKTFLIIGATDAALSGVQGAYGTFHHAVSASAVATLWNATVVAGAANNTATYQALPSVLVGGKSIAVQDVDNAVPAVHKVVFFGAAAITPEDAAKKLLELTDGKKEAVIKEVLSKAQVVAGSDLNALLK